MKSNSRWWRSAPVLLAFGSGAAALGVELVFTRLHGPPAELVSFFGRMHPLLVHLPIGMFVLLGLAEAATLAQRFRTRIDAALGLALPIVLLSALAAFVLGHMLAAAGGYPARLLGWHRKLELVAVLATGLSLVAWTYQAHAGTRGARAAFRALLGLSLGVLSIGAHFGGSLTHGDTYLTQYAPSTVKALLGIHAEPPKASAGTASSASAAPSDPLLFADAVAPILQRYCVSCHGPEKVKGKLRIDSLKALLEGGENGPVLVPGAAAQSELVKRLRLPTSDDKHMPPEDKPAPNAGEIALIEFWIDRGASATARVRDALPPADARSVLEKGVQANAGAAPLPLAPPAPNASTQTSTKVEPTSSSPSPASTSAARPQNARAVLAQKCQSCHGPNKQESKLRVDSLAALMQGGFGGPVLVPGNPDKSELIRRARLPIDDDDHMPPRKKPQLSREELTLLEAWVAQGAGAPKAIGASEALAASPSSEAAPATRAKTAEPSSSTESASAPAAALAVPSATAVPTPSSSTAAPARAPAVTGEAMPRHGGCAACTIGTGEEHGSSAPAFGLGVLFALALWQRRRERARASAPTL